MPKRRIGLQKDVLSIFKGVPLSGDEPVASLRRMPILEPPKRDSASRQREYAPAPQPVVCETSPTSVEPEPVVPESVPGGVISEKPAAAEPQAQGETKPAGGGSPVKVFASKKPKTAVAIKALRPAKGGMQQSIQQMKDRLFTPKAGVSRARQKAMVVLVPVLAIVLVFVFAQVLSSPSRGLAKDKPKTPAAARTDSGGEIDWKLPAPYAAALRDPMQVDLLAAARAKAQSPAAVEPEAEELIVKSILHSQSKPSAVIGAQIVHEGDTIFGATIVIIHKDGVEFEKDGKRWTQKIEN